jgi:hypothetical protein
MVNDTVDIDDNRKNKKCVICKLIICFAGFIEEKLFSQTLYELKGFQTIITLTLVINMYM